jgi:hypothetical protein
VSKNGSLILFPRIEIQDSEGAWEPAWLWIWSLPVSETHFLVGKMKLITGGVNVWLDVCHLHILDGRLQPFRGLCSDLRQKDEEVPGLPPPWPDHISGRLVLPLEAEKMSFVCHDVWSCCSHNSQGFHHNSRRGDTCVQVPSCL